MKIIDKFIYAFHGLKLLFFDKSVLLQFIIAFMVIFASLLLQVTLLDFLFILIAIFIVIICEMINTTVENLCDLYNTQFDMRIKMIKDMSAGVVLFSSFFSILVAVLVLCKYIGG